MRETAFFGKGKKFLGILTLYKNMRVILLKLLILYKRFVSPLLLKRCRFYPSCSQYAYEAIEKKGAVKGIICAFVRILKCHPFHAGGYDPVK